MKRKVLLSVMMAVIVTGLTRPKAEAQSFIASFGVQQSWGVPIGVVRYVDDYYYGYEWVHTRQIVNHGYIDFQIVLQRGPIFLEITLDRFGRVYRTVRRDYYPLAQHVCGPSCGYHANYYRSHYAVCSSHNHYGHNHVVYYNRPRGNAYGYYRNRNRYVHRDYRDDDHRRDHDWHDGDRNDDHRGSHGNGYGKGNSNGHGHGNGYGKGNGHSGDYGKGNGNGHGNGKGNGYNRGNGNSRGNAGHYNSNGRSGSTKSAGRSSNGRSSGYSKTTRVRVAGRN